MTTIVDGPTLLRLAARRRGPIIEPDDDGYRVTFVFGDRSRRVRDVLLFCPAIPDGWARLDDRGDGAFAGTFHIAAGARVKYHFCPDPPADADQAVLARSPRLRRIDYFNPTVDRVDIPALRLRMVDSLLSVPDAPAALPPASAASADRIERLSFAPASFGHGRAISLYRPAGDGPRPLVILFASTNEWRGPDIFDRVLATGRVSPFVGVLIDGGRRFAGHMRDLGGGPELSDFVTAELLPAVARRAAIRADGHVAAGFSAGAVAAAAVCADRPDLFDRLLAISPALHLGARMDVLRAAAGPPRLVRRYAELVRPPAHAYLAAGDYEEEPSAPILSQTRQLAEVLHASGGSVHLRHGPSDHNTVAAQIHLADGLAHLLPAIER
jgi:enterochelin esterase-like enzyme